MLKKYFHFKVMKNLAKFIIPFASVLFFLFGSVDVYATHNRAGEITYVKKGPFTYEITLITYTYTKAIADRPQLDIQFGDGTYATVNRIEEVILPDFYKRNKYVVTHTYPGAGTYEILMQDQNRNEGVLNIPNSVDIVFAVKISLQINPYLAANSTPIMLNPPIDKAAKGQIFIHNPNAYDPDGDSLSYKLTVCLGDNGNPIASYTYPPAKNSLRVDPINGDLIWDYPETLGIYNVAMEIEEWRNGVKIGRIIRDMQIEVIETDNKPPVIDPMPDICVTAGTLVKFTVTGHDSPNEKVSLSSTGGVYQLNSNPATFQSTSGTGSVQSDFLWQTNCSHVRKQPYLVIFKTSDNNPEQVLSAYLNVKITVVAPAPENVHLEPMNNAIWVRWDPSVCTQAKGYHIYRKNRRTDFVPDSCQVGVPDNLGYKLVGTVDGSNTTQFLDNDNGAGLIQGYEYCYLVTAFFEDGAESYASEETCSELTRGVPIMLKTSVTTTDEVNGAIHVAWLKPFDFDTVSNPPPYRYQIYRSDDLYGAAFTDPVYIYGLDSTSYIDSIYNTRDKPRIYKMGLFNKSSDGISWSIIGVPSKAASLFLKLKPGDNQVELNLEENVPWENYSYEIYRRTLPETDFQLITTIDTKNYVDQGLTNGQTYCYKVKSFGKYGVDYMPKPLINFSQEACSTPIDTFPPCPPYLTVINSCDSLRNNLVWTNPNHSCANDVLKYNIYYTSSLQNNFELIKTIEDPNDTSFIHIPGKTLAGCYIVTAIDSFGNESAKTNKVCADNCDFYRLPNTFSPDNNGVNDIFKPYPYQLVEKIDIKIYSRWGNLVYRTENPDINWDGKNMLTKQAVPPGVYYYVCDVWEYRLAGLQVRNLTGFIHIFVGGSGTPGK